MQESSSNELGHQIFYGSTITTNVPSHSNLLEKKIQHFPFQLFRKQDEAFSFKNQHPKHEKLHVFSLQYQTTYFYTWKKYLESIIHNFKEMEPILKLGKQERFFLVCPLDLFWFQFYEVMLLKNLPLHCYEMFEKDTPCHLYFDIELQRVEQNKQWFSKFETQFAETFCSLLWNEFVRQFPSICLKKLWFIELESLYSTDKFSRHVIVKLETSDNKLIVFGNNQLMGTFVRNTINYAYAMKSDSLVGKQFFFAQKIASSSSPEQHWEQYLIQQNRLELLGQLQNEDNYLTNSNEEDSSILLEEQCIVDTSVYSKNRSFRLVFSSKLDKDIRNIFSLKSRLCCSTNTSQQTPQIESCEPFSSNRSIFLASLASHWQMGPLNQISNSFEILEQVKEEVQLQDYQGPLYCKHRSSTAFSQLGEHALEISITQQEIPNTQVVYDIQKIHQFVKTFCSQFVSSSYLKKILFFEESKTLVYSIQNFRYCENVKRCHKSNHVLLVADLNRLIYYQKCLDPECQRIDFRGVEQKIPQEYLVSKYKPFANWSEEDLNQLMEK